MTLLESVCEENNTKGIPGRCLDGKKWSNLEKVASSIQKATSGLECEFVCSGLTANKSAAAIRSTE